MEEYAPAEELVAEDLITFATEIRSAVSGDLVYVPFSVRGKRALVQLPRGIVGDDIIWSPASGRVVISCSGCLGTCKATIQSTGPVNTATCESSGICLVDGCTMTITSR